MRSRIVLLTLISAVLLSACAGGANEPRPAAGGAPQSSAPVEWTGRDPVVYSVVVAEVLDDIGTAPPVVYVVDSVCPEGGQVEPSELSCSAPIPAQGREELTAALERYAQVEFVSTPDAAVDADGSVKGGGLLFWLGPVKDRANGEIRVGANYTSVLTDERAGGVNLAMQEQAGSWIVTGAAGLGGCPA